jgi:hypothetical protein
MHPPWPWSGSSGTGFDSQSVVYGNPELLLASEVALGCLDGDVAELVAAEMTAGETAQAGSPGQGRDCRPVRSDRRPTPVVCTEPQSPR